MLWFMLATSYMYIRSVAACGLIFFNHTVGIGLVVCFGMGGPGNWLVLSL